MPWQSLNLLFIQFFEGLFGGCGSSSRLASNLTAPQVFVVETKSALW